MQDPFLLSNHKVGFIYTPTIASLQTIKLYSSNQLNKSTPTPT